MEESSRRSIRKVRKYTAFTEGCNGSQLEDNQESNSGEKRKRKERLLKGISTTYMVEGTIEVFPAMSIRHELQNMNICKHCNCKKYEHEAPTFCCQNGRVKLVSTNISDELYDLYTSQTEEAKTFQKDLRAYNSIYAFTSFGVKLDKNLASSRDGVFTFRALGQVYHMLPALAQEGDQPCYFQMYFYDTDNEIQNRMHVLQETNLSEAVVVKIKDILEHNPYAQFFRTLKHQSFHDNFKIRILADVKTDQRVYNLPSADQVAAVWVEGNSQNTTSERQIVVHAHSGKTYRIHYHYGCYDPLQYPMLFPNGEVGWHPFIDKVSSHQDSMGRRVENLQMHNSVEDIIEAETIRAATTQKRNKVSCREYYCYKLQIRDGSKCILLYARRLLQQFVVDQYIKLETTRLDFFRYNQKGIRFEIRQGIVDSVIAGETRGSDIGKRLILPASFIGGPRDMRRRYLDAMSLVEKYGKPDLFITMTCNPDWKEITTELKVGQVAQDRPDLTVRVFRAKLQDLKDQLFNKKIFGEVAARVYVIEFQKRGLPHAHILIILQQGYKITSSDQFDNFVSAEIPHKEKYSELHELVVKHMMHGPCGNYGKTKSCIVNGQCRYHYPRQFCRESIQGKDGYPVYKRRNDGLVVQVGRKMFDNRWVVPYNSYLLSRYNCHINVEICSTVTAVKYIYKYIYKGHDKVAIYIAQDDGDNVVDEIKQFQDARWVCPHEAFWRIYEFDLSEMSPPVINLPVHLPNQQIVYYREEQNLDSLLEQEKSKKTMLTEYFWFYANNTNAEKYLYKEFPEHYVWNGQSQMWIKRIKRQVVGRVNGANPREGERYYLRLLLNHVRGPKSYEDLLTFNDVQYLSFKEAAEKRGLLESDDNIIECLKEATSYQMPSALRKLFAIILFHCQPKDVRNLWNDFFEPMSQDYRKEQEQCHSSVISRTLQSIDYFLGGMGSGITEFDLPPCSQEVANTNKIECREIQEERSIKIPLDDYDAETKLNLEQETAFNIILDRINARKSGVFFIDGPGGTGKTFLYRALLAKIRSKGMVALATASSGVAASIMAGGRTAHSRFQLPLNPTDTSLCGFSKQDGTAKLLRMTSLIIWDEAPMVKRFAIETLDRSLKDIMDTSEIFGGKVIVFGGDFRQVLPVVPQGSRAEIVDASFVNSYLWGSIEILKLVKNMRTRSDSNFGEFLLRIGNGEEPTIEDSLICLPEEIVIKNIENGASEDILIKNIFPSLETNYSSLHYMISRAILTTKNEYVDELNERMIQMIPGDTKTFLSFDQAEDCETSYYYNEEFLNTLTPNGLPPHKLVLKENCPIMLLRNLNPSIGLCNGTRLICRGFEKNIIYAQIAIGQFQGETLLIPRIPLKPAENKQYPFKFIRKQFPVRLCFAMTINKAQGQTIPEVGIYLRENVFSHGQLYVALSRGISMATTKILVKNKMPNGKIGSYTKNVVYKEVLLPSL